MVWGLMLGFFMGLIALFWFKEATFSRRHQMGRLSSIWLYFCLSRWAASNSQLIFFLPSFPHSTYFRHSCWTHDQRGVRRAAPLLLNGSLRTVQCFGLGWWLCLCRKNLWAKKVLFPQFAEEHFFLSFLLLNNIAIHFHSHPHSPHHKHSNQEPHTSVTHSTQNLRKKKADFTERRKETFAISFSLRNGELAPPPQKTLSTHFTFFSLYSFRSPHHTTQKQSKSMSTPSRRRLMKDFKRLQSDPPGGISGAPCSDNIMLWNAVIFGPGKQQNEMKLCIANQEKRFFGFLHVLRCRGESDRRNGGRNRK